MRVQGDRHLAEDITSETVLALLGSVQSESSQEIMNPAGWLRTVAGRRVQDHFRAVSRVRHLIEEAAGMSLAGEVDPAKHIEVEETRAEVRQVMDQLSDQHRVALEWKYLDKLSVREIADRWATTEKSAESILFRARREFRDQLNNRQAPEAAEKPCNGSRASQHAPPPLDQSRPTSRQNMI
jgi:RNA polymerase sigma factor (sigma-70 family)